MVAELEKRGEDLGDLKIGLLPVLRDIAAGRLLPDVVVLYAGRPSVMKQLAAMPVAEQRRVVSGEVAVPEPARYRAGSRAERYRPDLHGRADAVNGQDEMVRRPNVASIAAYGNPRDVGEMAAELILGCPDRAAALAGLLRKLADGGLVSEEAARAVRPLPQKRQFSVRGLVEGDD